MTDRLVNAETLAADVRTVQVMVAEVMWRLGRDHADFPVLLDVRERLNRIAALPPEPRLDALLAAARGVYDANPESQDWQALGDALAAFEEKGS